jgi:hypothetical protein
MADTINAAAPIVGIITLAAFIFSFLAFLRYLNYRETVVLAEKGLLPPRREGDGKDTLRWGIVASALGLALCIGIYPVGFAFPNDFPFKFGPWMLAGLLLLFFGLALILIHALTRADRAAPAPPERKADALAATDPDADRRPDDA